MSALVSDGWIQAATDNMKLQLWGCMGGFERARIRDRMKRGMEQISDLPDSCARKLPEGVEFKRHNERVNSGVFGFNEYARTLIPAAFQRAAKGDRLMQIAKDMAATAEQFGIEIGSSNGFKCFGTKSLRDTFNSRWWLCEKPSLNFHAKTPDNVSRPRIPDHGRTHHKIRY